MCKAIKMGEGIGWLQVPTKNLKILAFADVVSVIFPEEKELLRVVDIIQAQTKYRKETRHFKTSSIFSLRETEGRRSSCSFQTPRLQKRNLKKVKL